MKGNRDGKPAAKDGSIPAGFTRRRMLQGAGKAIAAAALPMERLTNPACDLRPLFTL